MNKEQAKLRLETNLINYQNKLKFMAKGSMFSRWLSDSILTCEIALKNCKMAKICMRILHGMKSILM